MTAEYEIEVAFSLPTRLEEIKKRATDVLLRAEIPNKCKHIAYNELMESESVERFISNVNWGATLPAFVKDRLLETV
jgi:broad specificity polyphosphatase/5'/3'-nucleotidase SurE